MTRLMISAAISILLVPCVCAADSGVELPRDAPLPILIENVRQAEEQLGLTADFIRAKVELQFRRNGIRPVQFTNEDYFVYVNIGVTDRAFSWSVAFERWVTYEVGRVKYSKMATTFEKGGRGVADPVSAREFIINAVLSQGVDLLSNEILRSQK